MGSLTSAPNDPRLTHGVDAEPVPQAAVYLVLSDEERAKGFVQPVRQSYLAKLHAHLDAVWAQRSNWTLATAVTKECALDGLFSLDFAERNLLAQAASGLAEAGRSLLVASPPRWSESESREAAPPDREFMCERPWVCGEPIEWSFLICRMSGLSIPLLTEEQR